MREMGTLSIQLCQDSGWVSAQAQILSGITLFFSSTVYIFLQLINQNVFSNKEGFKNDLYCPKTKTGGELTAKSSKLKEKERC